MWDQESIIQHIRFLNCGLFYNREVLGRKNNNLQWDNWECISYVVQSFLSMISNSSFMATSSWAFCGFSSALPALQIRWLVVIISVAFVTSKTSLSGKMTGSLWSLGGLSPTWHALPLRWPWLHEHIVALNNKGQPVFISSLTFYLFGWYALELVCVELIQVHIIWLKRLWSYVYPIMEGSFCFLQYLLLISMDMYN